MWNRLFITICALICSLVGLAQQEPVFNKTFVPDEKIHDFGTIQEKDGPVSHVFLLTNKGAKPLAISDVSVWCGCTTTEFSKEPIRPGQTGRVKVTFNPSYRPGKFSKEVVVLTEGGASYVRLWVKGTVVGMQHPVTDDHPYCFGSGLYMNLQRITFRALKRGEQQTVELRLANDTKQSMTIDFLRQPNNRVLQMPERLTLKPGERRSINVSYKAVREHRQKCHIDIVPRVNGKAVKSLRVTWLPVPAS